MQLQRQGIALAYEQAGQGEPALLLVHGWGASSAVMRPLYQHLQRTHRVVNVDLRGFGRSDAPAQEYSIVGYADDLVFVIEQLGLERPFVIGHSMGGIIALEMAARHAQRVCGAAILEAMVAAPAMLDGLRPVLAGVRSAAYRTVVNGLMRHLCGPGLAPDLRELVAESVCPQHVLISAMEGMLDYDSAAAARQVRGPLLYVGTHHPYADLAHWRALCPQLVTVQLDGCGHYFPLEAPERLHEAIVNFLRTLPVDERRASSEP